MREFDVLFPGEKVQFSDTEEYYAKVYPIAFEQIQQFSESIMNALRIVLQSIDPADLTGKESDIGRKVVTILSPIVLKDLLGVIKNCVRVYTKADVEVPDGIKYLPHYQVAPIINIWLRLSFVGDNKINPWVETVKNLVSTVKGMNLLPTLSKD